MSQAGGGHALAELTQNDLKGFFDPSQPIDFEQMMQANPSILFWESKQKIDPGNGTDKYHAHFIPITSVHCPVAAYTDFSPEFVHQKDRMLCIITLV